MNFELLANELILDIFEYLNSTEILCLFYGLNDRLNQLVYIHFQRFPLDFRSVLKEKFDYICQNILPSITDQITSICLSNDDDTPDQPNLFFSYSFHFQQFSNLQSISLYSIRSTVLINEIISHSPDLIYLDLRNCDFDEDIETAEICLYNIWNLKYLKYCFLNDMSIPLLTTTCISLERLSIENYTLSFDRLISLLQNTPNLQNLNIKLENFSDDVSIKIPSLTTLTIDFYGQLNLLRNFPNLLKLTATIHDTYIDGYQWEELITTSLPKLRTFHLLMYYQFKNDDNEKLEELFQSFQTKFWLDEHQWFIQYDQHVQSQSIHLYAVPYSLTTYTNYLYDISKSTCPIENQSHSANYVRKLFLKKSLIKSTSEFSNIEHLELTFPFNDTIRSLLPKVDHLKSLEIISNTSSDDIDQSIERLRLLINQASHLSSLTMDYLITSQLSTTKILNKSVYKLDLMANDGHFYGSECLSLIQSLLENQCQVLLINIENRSIVLDLINNMSNLRALTFQCQDDQWGDSNESLLIDDELVLWLKNRLPSNCSIMRDEYEMSAIRLWIR